MIRVKQKAALFLALLMFCTFLIVPIRAVAGNASVQTIFVVYDSPTRYGDDFPLVASLVEFLGHFAAECRLVPVDSWQAGALRDADIVVYAGLTDRKLPEGLIQEMAQAKRVIWFEKNIEQMAAYLQWRDFTLEGPVNGWSYFNYKKEYYMIEWLNIVVAKPGAGAQVVATVKNIDREAPLAWQRDNIYFCGLLSVDQFFMPTLGELLNQFIPNDHLPSHQVLIRIEDVSPVVDPKAVKAVLDTIIGYKIPFSVGVIPVAVDGNGKKTALHESPAMVQVLQEAQAHGASIIMHGYTHQNDYSPKTGEGYEFWNARDDKPMNNDEAFTSERLEAGIAELVRCGLTPVAFEPPHYAMSTAGYNVLSRYFNIFSGQVQISDQSERESVTLPYLSRSVHLNGMLAIPENMGYYDGKQFLAEDMLRYSAALLDVEDGFAGFFYHGYLPPDKLPFIIEGLRAQGYEFFDLRRLPIKVQSSQITITGHDGKLDVQVDESLRKAWEADKSGGRSLMERIGDAQIWVLSVVVAAFLAIIVKLRMNVRKHYEQ